MADRQKGVKKVARGTARRSCFDDDSKARCCNARCRRVAFNNHRRWVYLLTLSALVAHSWALQPVSRTSPGLFGSRSRSATTTRRRMVLTTPEFIIEQASTQNLLDDLIDESVRTSARRPIMMQFDPSSGWIWKRWKGTIFSETWDSCVAKMLYASIVFVLCHNYPGIKETLSGFNILWGQLLSVTTFTLTFFVNQSYALWRKCYELSRRLQGRLQDLDMTLAAHAARKPAAKPTEPTTYTPGSRQVLELVSRYIRLFNLLTYASFTRSHRPILTPRGMRRLVERGLMTPDEREVLVDAEIPATQRHNAVLLWIIRVFIEGREAGHFVGGPGFEDQFLEKVHIARAQYGAIGDELQGRMPLAYAHIVQVLVDLVLWMYPFMAISSGMSGLLCVLGTGLLTVGYQGLFDLAKQFLDPYDNESYGRGEDPLVVDTLIAETNAASIRWMNGLDEMPLSGKKIHDGELSDYLLPVRGYSVEELQEKEREQLQKEREMQELLQRKEDETRKAEAMIPALINTTAHAVPATVSGDVILGDVNGDSGSWSQLPKTLATTNLSTCQDLTQFIDDAFALKDSIPQALVPEATFWGTSMADNSLSSSESPSQSIDIDEPSLLEPKHSPESKESSPSLVEVPNGESTEEPLSPKLTLEDYERQVEEILRAEREELLETQAILNAPPGASSLEVLEKDESLEANGDSTEKDDELAVLEMDMPEEETEPTPETDAMTTDHPMTTLGPDRKTELVQGGPQESLNVEQSDHETTDRIDHS